LCPNPARAARPPGFDKNAEALAGLDHLGDQTGFRDGLGLAFDDVGGAVVDGERRLRHDGVMPAG